VFSDSPLLLTMSYWRAAFTAVWTKPWAFFGLWLATLLIFWRPVQAAFSLALQNELYSHLPLIPIVSIALVYFRRETIFQKIQVTSSLRTPLLVLAAVGIAASPWLSSRTGTDQLWLPFLVLVLLWIIAFLLLNGPKAALAALFPLCFLALMIPVPSPLLERAVVGLQTGSAEVSYFLFKALRIPVLRDHFQFSLPGLSIEVAEECSGIHSAVALLIAALLGAHLLLRSTWKQIVFSLCTIPVAIFKNGIRIVTLSYLGVYVDRSILDGPLHHQGGAVFALVGLALLLPILLLLRRFDNGRKVEAQP
jgi:exosortase